MRDIYRGGDTEQQFCKAWHAVSLIQETKFTIQSPSLMNMETAHLLNYSYYFLVHAWGLIRTQEFHGGWGQWSENIRGLLT